VAILGFASPFSLNSHAVVQALVGGIRPAVVGRRTRGVDFAPDSALEESDSNSWFHLWMRVSSGERDGNNESSRTM
jgi:hypothetical protein